MVVVTEQNDDPHGKHEVIKSGKCPDCEAPLTISEGCYTCVQCGSSACSI